MKFTELVEMFKKEGYEGLNLQLVSLKAAFMIATIGGNKSIAAYYDSRVVETEKLIKCSPY